jgi:ligand-binding SRPBCC domain-containing protein
MHIQIKTLVENSLKETFDGFNEDLFLKLAPPFPPVKLLRFDGCKTNDRVVLKLNFMFFSQIWESLITDDSITANEIYFIDEGVKLPFFLKKWHHRHILKSQGKKTLIIDDIHFSSPFWITDILLYPVLYLQFAYRIPIYKKCFKKA